MSETNAAKAARAAKQVVRCYYLLNEEQGADLEELQLAWAGLGQLACNDVDGECFDARIDRLNLQALISVFGRRLSDIVRFPDLETIWADRMTIQQVMRP